jgi:hypothetical protein
MKKKLLSLFALLCLVLPACIGLVGCGEEKAPAKTDAEILSTAYGQVVTSITDFQAQTTTTTSARSATDSTTTDTVFYDVASFDNSRGYLSVGIVAVMQQIYSNEDIVSVINNLKAPLKVECSYLSTGKYTDMSGLSGLTIYSTIDKTNNKIMGYCTFGYGESSDSMFLALEINYNFTKNEIVSFQGYLGPSGETTNTFFVLKYSNSKFEMANISSQTTYTDGSNAQTEANALTQSFNQFYSTFSAMTTTTLPGDFSQLFTTAIDAVCDALISQEE